MLSPTWQNQDVRFVTPFFNNQVRAYTSTSTFFPHQFLFHLEIVQEEIGL